MNQKMDNNNKKSLEDLGRQFSNATIFMHDAIARKAGLASSDHKYLGILIENGPMAAGELSRKTGLTTGAVTGLIDRLEKKELIERKLDKNDRRKIIVVPCYENAMNLFGDFFDEMQQKITNLKSQFTKNEIEIIKRYLLSAIKIMKEITESLQDNTHK